MWTIPLLKDPDLFWIYWIWIFGFWILYIYCCARGETPLNFWFDNTRTREK